MLLSSYEKVPKLIKNIYKNVVYPTQSIYGVFFVCVLGGWGGVVIAGLWCLDAALAT